MFAETSLLWFIAQGAFLGISAAAAPGPLQTLLVTQALARGWRRAAPVTLAPLITDIPIAAVLLLMLNQVPDAFLAIVRISGGALLLFLGWRLLLQWQNWEGVSPVPDQAGNLGLRWAILMNFLSPGPYLFWSLVNGPLLLDALALSSLHGLLFLASFYGIFIGGMLLIAAVFARMRHFGPPVIRTLLLISVFVFALFGALLIRDGLLG